MKIVLASGSARRRELLSAEGIEFLVDACNIEESFIAGMSPVAVTRELALRKASTVAEHHSNALVIGSDTVISLDGTVVGKASSRQEAVATLTEMSGRWHDVVTSVAAVNTATQEALVKTATTHVLMGHNTQQTINAYVDSQEATDMAGSYAIQAQGRKLVNRIDGSMETVIGFPMELVRSLLAWANH